MKKSILSFCALTALTTAFSFNVFADVLWQDMGGFNAAPTAMATFNGNLYVAGASLTSAGGVSVNHIAKWDGSAWSEVGSGITGGSGFAITSMCVYNSELYVGGSFTTAGGISVNNIARWNGTTWTNVGTGVAGFPLGVVGTMLVYSGDLIVGGSFLQAGSVNVGNIARWNGTAWSAFGGTGLTSSGGPFSLGGVHSMTIYNSELVAAGLFTSAGSLTVNNIAKWNGSAWSDLGTGLLSVSQIQIPALQVYNGDLYAGGNFNTAGSILVNGIARWNGTAWSATMSSLTTGATVNCLLATSSGLYVGGSFTATTPVFISNIGKWNGTQWIDLGNGLNSAVNALALHNGQLIVTGGFTALAFSPSTPFNRIVKLKTLLNTPTVNTSALRVSNVTASSMQLDWTNGNGKKRLVVARSGAAVDSIPEGGATYQGNSTFGSGTKVGSNNYSVYTGTGSTVTVTALNPDQIYHFSAYEFNDSTLAGFESYNVAGPSVASKSTRALEPTISGSRFEFLSGSFTLDVSLTPGNGSKRIIVARQGSPVNKMPTDTVEYTGVPLIGTGGTDLGGGNYVIYNGTGNSVSLFGVPPNTMYYFTSFEYNGSTPFANNYLLTNPPTAYQSSLTAEPTSPSSNLQFTNVKDSSMTLTWTVGNGQRRMVVAGTSAIVSLPMDGVDHFSSDTFARGADLGFNQYVIYSGTSNSVTLKGLNPNTTYHFAAFEFNGTNTANNYLLFNPATASKSTLIAEPTNAASNLVLSPITNGITTINWTSGNGSTRIAVAREGAPINILPEDGKSYTANNVFGSGENLGQGNFVCYIGSSNTFNLQGLDPSKLYYVAIIEYNGAGGGSNYKLDVFPIADNMPAEPTTASTNMTFTGVTASSVTVSWTKGNGAYRILIAKDGSAVSKKPADGSVYVANSIFGSGADLGLANFVVYNGVGNTATITGLSNNTAYHFALFEFNKDASGPANYASVSLNGSVNIGNPPVGVNEVERGISFLVYPNPSAAMITFGNKALARCNVRMTDMAGKEVDSFDVDPGMNAVRSYESLPAGLYTICLRNGGDVQYRKISLVR